MTRLTTDQIRTIRNEAIVAKRMFPHLGYKRIAKAISNMHVGNDYKMVIYLSEWENNYVQDNLVCLVRRAIRRGTVHDAPKSGRPRNKRTGYNIRLYFIIQIIKFLILQLIRDVRRMCQVRNVITFMISIF